MIDTTINISLPSLIHRVGGDAVQEAKLLAQQHACQLKRVRRSRNWMISGEALQIQAFCQCINTLHPESLAFMIRKITPALQLHQDKLESPQQRLKRLLVEDPNMTLSELMELTQCSLVEARRARFDADDL
ncbi:ribosome recycling factor family protein [Vibrio halioticoli]|uniref:ribosome recycling factor family protein n=1 Tax=Vibrio TaxID=662 RepID=UPI00058747FC|nr:ribosome recycling factor family protein [Vibrio halioticoli]MPW36675.1 ribosome recycling factor [Vibrio sp. B1Z05]